jgi:PAS domain S-box-containing protein
MNLLVLISQFGAVLSVAPYVILYLIPAAIGTELALFGWQRRQAPSAVLFTLVMAAVVFWSVCHALSVASSTLQDTLFWAQVQYGGIVLVGPIWLLFILAYTKNVSRITPALQGGLLVPAALSYAAVLTNGSHYLWWSDVGLDSSRPFGSLSITRGPLFWLHYSYCYGCVLLGIALLIPTMFTAPAPKRRQARLLVLSALFPLTGNLAHILGVRTDALDDPTPFLFCASGLIVFYGALRYRFLDLAPATENEIFESMPDGIIALDQAGVITAVNDPAPRLLAAKIKEWFGRTFLQAIAGSPLEIDLRALLASPSRAVTQVITYESDAGLRAIELRLRPLYSNDSHTGSLLVVRDRSAQAQMEQTLARRLSDMSALNRLARAANAATATNDLVWAIIRELMRALPGDRIVIGLLESDHAALHLVIDEPVYAAPRLEQQKVTGDDFELLQTFLRDGQTRAIQVSDPLLQGRPVQAILQQARLRIMLVVPLSSQASPLGAMFIGHADDRAIAPDELELFETVGELVAEAIVRTRHCEQGQEASRVKSAVLAMVSHELRTPQTSIIGFADLLERGFFGELPEATHEPLSHIRRNSQTVLRLINDILDFTKMEAGHFRIDLGPVDLLSVIEQVVGTMQPQIHERGLDLKVETTPGLPQVYANSERLAQVLTNLLSNAVKFTDQGSIVVRATSTADRVQFGVADTGIGIAPEHLAALFQEFQQIEHQHRGRSSGTGLGLAISRRLMQLMGGSLWVESTPGIGSTFYGDVPIVRKNLQEKARGAGSN